MYLMHLSDLLGRVTKDLSDLLDHPPLRLHLLDLSDQRNPRYL
jgi:hypothetical protein